MTDAHENAPWWWSTDDERFFGPFGTREDAEREARDDDPDHGFYLCQATKGAPLKLSDSFDAERLLEYAEDDAYEFADPDGDRLFDVPKESVADLQIAVRAAIDKWQKEHDLAFIPWAFAWQGKSEWVDVGDQDQ